MKKPILLCHVILVASLAALQPAAGSTLNGTFVAIPGETDYDLTAEGNSDWAYWDTAASPASGTPTNQMAGASLIGSMTDESGGGNIKGTTSPTRPTSGFTFTNGTSPANGTVNNPNPTGVFNTSVDALNKGASIDITLPTTDTYEIKVWAAAYSGSARMTASLPGATEYVNTTLAGGSVAPKSTRLFTFFATPDAANDVLDITITLDTDTGGSAHVVLQAVAVSVGGVVPDPLLEQDTVLGATNLNYGSIFLAAGAPVETPVRTLRYVNNGATNPIQINAVNITGEFTITDINKNGTPAQTPPFTLAPGAYVEISVQGTPAKTGPYAAFAGILTVTTNDNTQDKIVNASATIVAEGDVLNDNPNFALGAATATNWAPNHARISPGILEGATNALRVVGTGDPSGGSIGQANQAAGIANNISNFETVFYFSPVANFASYASRPVDGALTDRTMQYMVLSDDIDVRDGNILGTFNTGNILINLAYLPDGKITGGTPGFYVYDSGTAQWELAIATTLSGSTDSNADGILDTTAGDTLNVYRVSVKGSGFGLAGANYTISVSTVTPGGFTNTHTSLALSRWHGISGAAGTLAGHSFTTADESDSNSGGGARTPFWLGAATLHYIAAPEPRMVTLSTPQNILVDAAVATTGMTSLQLRNEGLTDNLEITALDFDDPSFSITPAPVFPITVAPGTSKTLDIQWDSAAAAPDTAARGILTVENNAAGPLATFPITAGIFSNASLFPNANFEVAGFDPVGDTDTFSFWIYDGIGVRDVPGLLPGSTTAAILDANQILEISCGKTADAWLVNGVFAIRNTPNRAYNIKVRQAPGTSQTHVNLRYEGGIWSVFDGVATAGGTWQSILDMTGSPLTASVDTNGNGSLDDPGDVKVPYQLRLSGAGWDTGTPTFQLEVLNAAGVSLASSAPGQTYIQDGPPSGGAGRIEFNSQNGSCPGFWVDDTNIALVSAGPGVVITSVTGGPGAFTIHYDSGGSAVNIQLSTTLQNGSFSDIATGETSGTYTATGANAPAGKAFYRVYIP